MPSIPGLRTPATPTATAPPAARIAHWAACALVRCSRRLVPASRTIRVPRSRRCRSPTPASSGGWARPRARTAISMHDGYTPVAGSRASVSRPATPALDNVRRTSWPCHDRSRDRPHRSLPVSRPQPRAGQRFDVRWVDAEGSGADDGLAIDDFSLTPVTGGMVLPTLSVNDVTQVESNSGTTTFAFTVVAVRPRPGRRRHFRHRGCARHGIRRRQRLSRRPA